MANCADNSYTIYYTNLNRGTIQIRKSDLITDVVDIALIGKTRLEYGEIFNENVLHVLERFAVEEDPLLPGTPDLSQTYANLLEQPTYGQIWYNKTQQKPFLYSLGDTWVALGSLNDVGGNSGVLFDGFTIPLPSKPNGDLFTEAECSWTVSPFFVPSEWDYMVCEASTSRVVNMKYRLSLESSITSGFANYQIIGISQNNSIGTIDCSVAPVPTPTPGVSSTPAPSVTPSITVTPSVTVTASVTPTPGVSATPTPTASVTATPGVSITPTPTQTPPNSATQTPSPSLTPTPAASITPTPAASITPTPAPTVTPTRTPAASYNPCDNNQGCDPTNANGNCGCPPGWSPVVGGCQRNVSPFDFQDCP